MGLEFIDCSLRDGGNLNSWAFTFEQVTRIVRGLDSAGVSGIEVGYRGGSGSHVAEHVGAAARCTNEFLNALPSVNAAVAVMVVPSVCPLGELDGLQDTAVTLVRVASYPAEFERSLGFISRLKRLGVARVSANLMAASHVTFSDLPAMAERARSVGANVLCLADSFGAMNPDGVREAVSGIRAATDLDVGFHGHNNLGLAFANAVAAVEAGATYVDGSLCSMARGAGNLSTEQWIGAAAVWKRLPKTYKVQAILDLADFVRREVLRSPVPATSAEIRMGIYDLHYYYWDLVRVHAAEGQCDPDQLLQKIAEAKPVGVDPVLVANSVSSLVKR